LLIDRTQLAVNIYFVITSSDLSSAEFTGPSTTKEVPEINGGFSRLQSINKISADRQLVSGIDTRRNAENQLAGHQLIVETAGHQLISVAANHEPVDHQLVNGARLNGEPGHQLTAAADAPVRVDHQFRGKNQQGHLHSHADDLQNGKEISLGMEWRGLISKFDSQLENVWNKNS
jgi:hypothetical protein